MSYTFELGPIRPPSEASSLLLRVTRNCPWNQCGFCMTYKKKKFSRRTVEEVKGDIERMRVLADRLLDASRALGLKGAMSEKVIDKARGNDSTPEHYYQQMAFWLYHGIQTVFLQDANSLILKTDELAGILNFLKEKFPQISRITSYARAKTVYKKSLDELITLRNAGLTRLHIGMESGCDKVLERIKKGVTAEEHIGAGQKAIKAGFDLSEYFMPGLGGKELSRENALDTARVVNSINPTFVRMRSCAPLPRSLLFDMMKEGEWVPLTEDEKIREIRLFVENLEGITTTVMSDHMMNLLEDVEGKMPEDKQKMLDMIDRYLMMKDEDRESFVIGRRLGYFRFLSDYRHDERVESIKEKLKEQFDSIDDAVLELLNNNCI